MGPTPVGTYLEKPMSEWYYAQNGERFGPVSFESLKALIEEGRVEGKNLIWRVGLSEWARAARFEELASEAVAEGNETPPPLPKRRSEAPKSKMPLIMAALTGTLFLMCLGCCSVAGIMGSREKARQDAEQAAREREDAETVKKELAVADGLWTAGKKSEAAQKYRELLIEKYEKHIQADRVQVYSRLVDFEYESGNKKAGSELLEVAVKKGIELQVSQPDAKVVFVTFQEEKKRLAAEQAEQIRVAAAKRVEEQRLANLSPEERLRQAKPKELFDAVYLQNQFAENQVAANENYKGKVLMLQGIVFSVETGGALSNHRIYLCDSIGRQAAECNLSKEAANSPDLRQLSRGHLIRVVGTCDGKNIIGDVILSGCRFIKISP